jgi:hypothetical protein
MKGSFVRVCLRTNRKEARKRKGTVYAVLTLTLMEIKLLASYSGFLTAGERASGTE